ncbi:MAG TPA: HIT domain-containing protein [Candidatus Nanoarchaeia archaeon]|nr:HIT domain-containing protein [Candidatus Nanoarchaeia archaeon]
MSDCVFCEIGKGNIKSNKIYENEKFFSIPDKNQKIKGHSLVISKEHFETIKDIRNDFGNELLEAIQKTMEKLSNEDNPIEGFNVVNNCGGQAGQVINHVHFHILPRREGEEPPKVY